MCSKTLTQIKSLKPFTEKMVMADLNSGAGIPNSDQDEEGDSDPEIRKLEGFH